MALYHKYRPQTFADVIGQEHIVKTLSNEVAGNRVGHAYLFSGPRGVGKTTLARILAKAVNCANRKKDTSEPCNSCNSCQEISGSRSIDVIEIDAASHTQVDKTREYIIENAQFRPTRSPYKVFIIDEVHMLSTSSFNALLKTLEEPPEYVIFILATTEMHKLPETIISRCQRFNFKKIPFDTLEKHLKTIAKEEKIKIEKEVIDRIINKSDGCVRDAVGLLDQIIASGEKNITSETASLILPTVDAEKTLGFADKLIRREAKEALELLNDLLNDGINLAQFNNDLVEILRIMMITKPGVKTGGLGLDLSDKVEKDIKKLADAISGKELVALIDLCMARGMQIKSSPLPQLPLEMAVIEWCSYNTDTRMYANDPSHSTGHSANYADATDINYPKSEKKLDNENQEKRQEEKEIERKTIVERVKNIVSRKPNFTIDEIQAEWDVFLEKIELHSPSLVFILKMAEPIELEGNVLKISVPYNFHQDKLMEKTSKNALETTLSEILGDKIRIEAVIEERKRTADQEELRKLASSLGGEIVG